MPRYRLLLVDLDGVIWRGSRILRDNIEWLLDAKARGAMLVYVTNNSTRSRRVYVEKLTRIMGYSVSPREIITSGYAVSRLLREQHGPSRVIVLGEEGLVEELTAQGHIVTSSADGATCPIDYVVVGLDRGVTYQKLRAAHEAVTRCGAEIAASNTDATIPVEKGTAPGAGALLAALERSCGKKPAVIAGKPEPYMYMLALKEFGAAKGEALAIGDRCDTDIEAARRAGIDSVLVLTGVAGETGERCRATYTVGSLRELDISL